MLYGHQDNFVYLDFDEKVKKGEKYQLVDIREPYELEIEGVSNAIHIPMGELVNRLDEIPNDSNVVFHCSSGKTINKYDAFSSDE